MSPRAAWRLDSLGFQQVYDYVAGEADWFNGEQSLQTNVALPVARPCTRCGTDLVTMTGRPEITLVG